MFEKDDERYLKRLIGKNEVVLFLGAGFSRMARNKLGEDFPTGQSLSQKLWEFLGYEGGYDGTSLQELYQAFQNAYIKRSLKSDFLNNNLLTSYFPESYKKITFPYWYKIYTIVKRDIFKSQYNVHHIKGTTEDFLDWLSEINSDLPKREDILRNTFPSLSNLLSFSNFTNVSFKSVNEFAKAFNRIPRDYVIKNERSAYLQGASPTWNDIFSDLDIPRTITDDLYFSIEDSYVTIENKDKLQVFTITGTAGSGKSTILKRLGLQLSQNGRTTFLCYSDFIPKVEHIADVLNAINERTIILFDNSKNVISQFNALIQGLPSLKTPPVLVFAIRSNHKDKLNYYLDPERIDHKDFRIPDLDDREIEDLLEILDKKNILGRLKGLSYKSRFHEFKYRAKKQILVAMKEATNGKSFNEIIKDEFDGINPLEAQILCLCVALNTELGFTNSKQDFVGFSKVTHLESLNFLNSVLQGTILWVGNNEKFMIRHRILADYMIKHCVSKEILKEAYIRVLSILAPELKNSSAPSRKFNLYKSLVNHKVLYRRFERNINKAREVYDSISEFFNDDSHFWLQYGSLEIEGTGGDLELAENYLNQAESLNPNYHYIHNAKCNLYYRQSSSQKEYSVALEYKQKADILGERLLQDLSIHDPHTHHIICRGEYYFISKWITDIDKKKERLSVLKSKIEKAVKLHPRDKKLDQALQAINRAYLQLGLNIGSLPDPDIVN